MSKVHITLVGGQPAPVFQGILEDRADVVVFISSQQTQRTASIIEKVVRAYVKDYCPQVRHLTIEATNLKYIKKAVEKLYAEYDAQDLTINISGGTKAWSHMFALQFNNRARFIYVDQSNVLWDLAEYESKQLPLIEINTLFSLYGNDDVQYLKISEYDYDGDKDAIFELENVWRSCRRSMTEAFKDIFNQYKAHNYKTGIYRSYSGDASITIPEDDIGNQEVELHFLKKDTSYYDLKLVSPNAAELAMNASWFEVQTAYRFSQCSGVRNVYMNCEFMLNDNAKNEIDIIVETENHYVFVECKTHLHTSTDIDKFKSAFRSYAGSAAKGILVSIDKLKPVEKEKCKMHNIEHFCIDSLPNGTDIQAALEAMLKRMLLSQNA